MCRDKTACISIAFILYLFCISTFHIVLYHSVFLSICFYLLCPLACNLWAARISSVYTVWWYLLWCTLQKGDVCIKQMFLHLLHWRHYLSAIELHLTKSVSCNRPQYYILMFSGIFMLPFDNLLRGKEPRSFCGMPVCDIGRHIVPH